MRQILMRFMLFGTFLFSMLCSAEYRKADLVVFSKDRPLQLYAFLESVETYITDLETISVIYRVTSSAYEICNSSRDM